MSLIKPILNYPKKTKRSHHIQRNSLRNLTIESQFIAVIASGNSINDIPIQFFQFLMQRCFVITLNYAPLYLPSHLNIWSDRKVSEFLAKHYHNKEKDRLFLTQNIRMPQNLESKIDYWFDRRRDGLQGNYTLVWLIMLLQKYFIKKTILLFGADMKISKTNQQQQQAKWYDRFTNFDLKHRGHNYNVARKLKQCSQQLTTYCQTNNIYNCTSESELTCFDCRDWRELLPLNIVHLCPTPLAGAPAHLSNIINKYTNHKSTSVFRLDWNNRKKHNGLRWDYDIYRPNNSQLIDLIQNADLIHLHGRVYPTQINNKPTLLQFHTPPGSYQPNKSFAEYNNRKLVIAQYHPRFYSDAFLVPNLIDIMDPMFMPEAKDPNIIKIFYSWATESPGGWSDKGSRRTKEILNKIKQKYKERVSIKIMHNEPHKKCMQEKRSAHICIDECVTGSYHLQSLEGCAVAAATFNNLDHVTAGFIKQITGTDSHPFITSSLNGLYDKLCNLIENPDKIIQIGKSARQWMEQYWHPNQLIQRYIHCYFNLILFNTLTPSNNNRELKVVAKRNKTQKSSASQFQTTSNQTTLNTSAFQNTLYKSSKRQLIANTYRKKQFYRLTKNNQNTNYKSNHIPNNPVTELYRKYQDKEIHIIGTGPSIFHLNSKNFRDKICLGINFSFEVIPWINYYCLHVIEVYDALKNTLDCSKFLLPETLVRQWQRNRYLTEPHRISVTDPNAIIYPIQNPAIKFLEDKHISLDKTTDFFTWSTTTHSAIHLAAYMGAKKIHLYGVDYQCFPNGKVHFNSKYYPEYTKQNWHTHKKHQQGDQWLTSQLTKLNITVINHSPFVNKSAVKELVIS